MAKQYTCEDEKERLVNIIDDYGGDCYGDDYYGN